MKLLEVERGSTRPSAPQLATPLQ